MLRQTKKNDQTGCIEWTGGRNAKGYGRVYCPETRKMKRAHRVAWERANGPIPDGLNVLHKCDNPCCVNIGHLFLGTLGANNADRATKGRTHRPHGPRKFRTETVEEARRRLEAGDRATAVANDLGISESYVAELRAGKYRLYG